MRKRKENQKGKKGKEERNKKEKQFVERNEGKRRKKEREKEDFSVYERSKFDSSKIKVGARSPIYVWTPKSWSFDKLQKVGHFPTWFTFSLRAI